MKIAMVGLGKMGANMAQRLVEHGHDVVAFDLNAGAREATAASRSSTCNPAATRYGTGCAPVRRPKA